MFLKWWFHEKRILQTNDFNYFLNKFYFRYPFTWLNMRPGNIVQICTCVTTLRILRPTLSKPTCGQPCLKAKMVPVCRKAWWLLENEKIIIISLNTRSTIFFFLSFCVCMKLYFCVNSFVHNFFSKAESVNVSSLYTNQHLVNESNKIFFCWFAYTIFTTLVKNNGKSTVYCK